MISLFAKTKKDIVEFEISKQDAKLITVPEPFIINFEKENNDVLQMENVIQYLQYHKGVKPEKIIKPLVSTDLKESGVDDWDVSFISKFGAKELAILLTIAYQLKIESLLHLASAQFAVLIKEKRLN